MKAFITTTIALLAFHLGFSQQEFMVTQYMHNGLFLNPAYAGVHGGLSASALHRQQWVGVDGAPSVQLFTLHSPVSYYNFSLGGTFYRDEVGISTEHGGYLSYAYRIPLSSTVKLSMGVQANFHNYSTNYSKAMNDLYDPGDVDVPNDMGDFKVNFGTGIFIHSDMFYVGISVPRLINQNVNVSTNENSFTRLTRHYYGTAGLVIPVSSNLIVKPNLLIKRVENSPIQVDLNLNTLIHNTVWLGASYRAGESLDALVGIQINPRFLVNYSYDFPVNEINASSHEIMVSYVIEKISKRIQTPRYF